MRSDQLLSKLKKRGQKGLRAEEIAKLFKFERSGSSNKIINILRKEGNIIEQDYRGGPYIYRGTEANKGTENEEIIEEEETTIAEEKKGGNKRDSISDIMKQNIKFGITADEIAEQCDISPKTVSYHIHGLRHKDGYTINLINGRYFINTKRSYIKSSSKNQDNIEPSNPSVTLEIELNDKELYQGIQMIRPCDINNYMDLLYKIIYYKGCAKSMINTNKVMKEVGEII